MPKLPTHDTKWDTQYWGDSKEDLDCVQILDDWEIHCFEDNVTVTFGSGSKPIWEAKFQDLIIEQTRRKMRANGCRRMRIIDERETVLYEEVRKSKRRRKK